MIVVGTFLFELVSESDHILYPQRFKIAFGFLMRRNKRLAAAAEFPLSPDSLSLTPIDFQSSSYILHQPSLSFFFCPQWSQENSERWILFSSLIPYRLPRPVSTHTRAHLYYKSSEYSVYLLNKKNKNPKKTPEKGIDDAR